MGYSTRHQLSIVSGNAEYDEVQEYINTNEDMLYALGDSFGENEDSCKWYESETDMRNMSEAFPDTLFLLEGEGEDSGDVWKEYYKNGKLQRCKAKLCFEEFNEKLLK